MLILQQKIKIIFVFLILYINRIIRDMRDTLIINKKIFPMFAMSRYSKFHFYTAIQYHNFISIFYINYYINHTFYILNHSLVSILLDDPTL